MRHLYRFVFSITGCFEHKAKFVQHVELALIIDSNTLCMQSTSLTKSSSLSLACSASKTSVCRLCFWCEHTFWGRNKFDQSWYCKHGNERAHSELQTCFSSPMKLLNKICILVGDSPLPETAPWYMTWAFWRKLLGLYTPCNTEHYQYRGGGDSRDDPSASSWSLTLVRHYEPISATLETSSTEACMIRCNFQSGFKKNLLSSGYSVFQDC